MVSVGFCSVVLLPLLINEYTYIHTYTGVAIGEEGTRARAALGAYSVTKNDAKNAPKHVISTPKIRKCSPDPFPRGGDTPLHTPPLKCPHYN